MRRGFLIIHYAVTKCSLVKREKVALLNNNPFTGWTKTLHFLGLSSVSTAHTFSSCELCMCVCVSPLMMVETSARRLGERQSSKMNPETQGKGIATKEKQPKGKRLLQTEQWVGGSSGLASADWN